MIVKNPNLQLHEQRHARAINGEKAVNENVACYTSVVKTSL